MQNPYDEFTDDLIYPDGHCDPISGSDSDFKYDDEECQDYAERLGMICVEVTRL